jgi:hypothetical protein
MANALPQAIGAQMVDRNRQVISMSGVGVEAHLTGKRRPAVHPSDASVAARQWPS